MKAVLYYPIFWLGYWLFKITKRTYWYPYVSFRRLFVITRGKLNDSVSRMLSTRKPPYSLSETELSGVLGKLDSESLDSMIEGIKRDGFYIFESRLAPEKVEALTKWALTTEAELIPPSSEVKRAVYDRQHLLSPRYQFSESELLENPLVQELTADPTLFAVAQGYLNCKPIQDLTAMWWSTVFSKEASSEAAQLYHFDMDRFKFIKFFFYLTDVDTYNGPHCYVRGSHRRLPENLWKDGRIQDEEIFKSFDAKDIVEITGTKGTIIAVDTRGLHKGKVLERGERLILQFEFTNSLFGAPYERVVPKKSLSPEVRNFYRRYPYSFQRFGIGK